MKKIITIMIVSFAIQGVQAQFNYTQITAGLTDVFQDGGSSDIKLVDIDGDGDLDIISLGNHGNPIYPNVQSGILLWKNNGNGTVWTKSMSGNFGYGGIAAGDVNNDGKMDVAYGMHHAYSSGDFGNEYLEVALGDGTGYSWTPYDDGLTAGTGMSWGMSGTDLADVNNDGLLDLGANSFGCCDGVFIFKNNGNGTWTKTDGQHGGNSWNAIQFGDFDNDGNVDFIVNNEGFDTEVGQVWKNNGLGKFSLMQKGLFYDTLNNSSYYMTFDLADVNNDGAKDISIVRSGGDSVFTYNKNTNSWVSISNGLPSSGVKRAALADMDMDGNCDAVIFGNAGAVTIYKGDGAGNWSSAATFTVTGSSYSCLRLGDFDHDGYTDIAYWDATANMLRVYLHTVNNPSLAIQPLYPKGNECFVPGSIQFVSWLSSVPTSTTASVSIDFSSGGPSGPWTNVVASASNSGTYQWIVPTVNSASCYLKFTITNGASTQSVTMSTAFGIGTCATPPPTAVQDEADSQGASLLIYPNPAAEKITVVSKGYVNDVVRIYNCLGNVVREKEIKQTATISVSDMAPGLYFINLKNQSIPMHKFIKQ